MIYDNSFCNVEIIFGDLFNFLLKEIPYEKILIVTSKSFSERGLVNSIENCLKDKDIFILDQVKKEPSIQNLESLHLKMINKKIDLIISLGGGSVIDTAKILSVILNEENKIKNISNFNNVIFNKNIPLYSIPTTAGSGAELTPFATVWDYDLNKKYSFQNQLLLPKLALYDYKLLKSLQYSVSVSSGLDTISHAFESIWNKYADPLSTSFSTQSLSLSIKAIRGYVSDDKPDLSLKNMQLASLLAALAIGRTKTGIAHSISYPLTSVYKIPHGIASSFVLPEVLLFNSRKDDGRLNKLCENLFFPSLDSLYKELINLRQELLSKLEIFQKLKTINIELISSRLIHPERAALNFINISQSEAEKILKDAISKIS